jgi:hypothetical protein
MDGTAHRSPRISQCCRAAHRPHDAASADRRFASRARRKEWVAQDHKIRNRRSVIRPKVNDVFNDRATLHHKGDVLQNGDIIQRIARDGDDICEFALFNRTGGLSGAEQGGGIEGRGLNSAERRDAGMNRCREFLGRETRIFIGTVGNL